MTQEISGYFYSCIQTAPGYYDLYLFLSGEPRWIIGITGEELARVFKESSDGDFLTVRI